jgi:hypothetical protein
MGGISEIPMNGTASLIIKSAASDQVVRNGGDAAGEERNDSSRPPHTDQAAAHETSPETPSKLNTNLHPLKGNPVTPSSDDDNDPPQPDFTRRGIHIPTRTR